MKKYILILLISGLTVTSTFAQEPEEDKVVGNAFESGTLIDAQTTMMPDAKTLEFIIQHKFGSMDQGSSNLWGIYGSSNVRLSLNYVPIKNLQIGAGITKKNMYTDFNAKYVLLRQTERKIPVSVAIFGNVAIDGRDNSAFGTGQVVDTKGETLPTSIALNDRFSYFSELIVSRRFGDAFSLQAGASFTHYNTVSWDYNHDLVGVHVSGKLKFSPQGSIIFNYDQPLKIESISEQLDWSTHPEPNLSLGVEFFTFTHAFQIYMGTANGILPQDMMMYNQTPLELKGKNLAFGFTITRLWMF